MPDTHVQTDNNRPRQQLGQMLKQTREKLGLAQKDIAAQLNLQIETIDAIEKDDQDRLPEATYVRGYVRSYGRLIKLDADMLIKLYDQASTPPPEIIPNIKKPAQASSRDKPVRAITYLITFTLTLLLLAWLQSKYIVEKKPDAASTSGNTGEQSYAPGQNPRPDTTSTTTTGQGTPAVEQEPLSLPSGAAKDSESVISETESADVPVVETAPAAMPNTDPAQITDHLTRGDDKLRFILTRDSWIEVHDANKISLYQGLARAGNEIRLSGKAPFSVLLGYAQGVEVRFNNEPFDPAPYANASIARFTLGAADNR